MSYTLSHIAEIIGADNTIEGGQKIVHLLLDSRKVYSPSDSLFFALKGNRRNGHLFIPELYNKGVLYYVVSEKINGDGFPGAIFLEVSDTLVALQQLAQYHRSRFTFPVIGITGSNGKTSVKEWLYQFLHTQYNIVRSPRSYNSQIGVPLSVWQMNESNTLGIFEAGISQQGEMARLERVIRPTIGVLTNIGEAHSEGFNDNDHKFREKLALFKNSEVLIGRGVDFEGQREFIELLSGDLKLLTWGDSPANHFVVRKVEKNENRSTVHLHAEDRECIITIPFSDDASVENVITCACVLLYLKVEPAVIATAALHLQPVNMRLEMKKGINHCSVINDSYSADLSSLEIALNFLGQQSSHAVKTVILSDFLQSALPDEELYARILYNVRSHHVNRLIGIGERISTALQEQARIDGDQLKIELHRSTDEFISHFRSSSFHEEVILVKGARIFEFEQIVRLLEQKAHQTVLEINLNAIAHNLKEYQNLLRPTTKIMAMVKAFAYGSGGSEITGILQYHKADYLGVAYADEGVELRKAGTTLPIMVMNPEENAFEVIVEHQLEPEIYSFELLHAFDRFVQQQGLTEYPVHLEIETGMNRLGFAITDIEELSGIIAQSTSFKIKSVFSHLAASEDPREDEFTLLQFSRLSDAVKTLKEKSGQDFISHIANSACIARLPELQMDMVRLGIGLYGIDNTHSANLKLYPVATLKSTIAQIKMLKSGESVGYNRKGVAFEDSTIATVRLGYADGYPRRLGNGSGKVWVNSAAMREGGALAPLIGSVCMDMIMIDITEIPGVGEGDEVVIFGPEISLENLAEWAGTIPYEIMTGISQRVKRVYYQE